MATIGGYLLEATFNHPTVGSGIITFKSDEDPAVDRGGIRADDDMASVDSQGNNIVVMTNNRWKVSGTAVIDMTGDLEEKLVNMAGALVDGDWTFTFSNGVVLSALGRPSGALELNSRTATMPLTISGGGKAQVVK